MPYVVEIYETKHRKKPFNEWLLALKDIKTRQKILVRLERLLLGNIGNCKPIAHGVHEIKLNFGCGYRIYFANVDMRTILLLCAGTKSSQSKDSEKAKSYFIDYKMRGKCYAEKCKV